MKLNLLTETWFPLTSRVEQVKVRLRQQERDYSASALRASQ